jgi:hypothetical protein
VAVRVGEGQAEAGAPTEGAKGATMTMLETGQRPVGTACTNCGAPLQGTFCHVCGQKAVSLEVSLRDLLHEAIHEFGHLDGKIVQTLKVLVTKPGLLTKELLEGRRKRYISPVRLYLTCSLVFFALAAVAPVDERPFFTIARSGSTGANRGTAEQIRDATVEANRAIIHNLPRVMFVLMPLFALVTWGLYRKARPFYAAHLYHSIHFHAFAFLMMTLTVSLRLAGGKYGSLVSAPGVPAILVYMHLSLHRGFGGSWFQTIWKGMVLWVLYLIVVVVALLALGLRAAYTILPTG